MMYYLCANDPESRYPEETKITNESASLDRLIQMGRDEIGDVWVWWIEDEEGKAVYDPNARTAHDGINCPGG